MRKQILSFFILIMFISLSGCSQGAKNLDDEAIPTVTVMKVKQEELLVEKVYDTILELDEEQYISAQVSGYVQQIYTDEGELVRPGDKIALLDNKDISVSVQRSNQEVQIAQNKHEKIEMNLDEAVKDLERKKQLYQAGAISQAELEKSELEWQRLSKDKEQTYSQLELELINQSEINQNRSSCEITAPDNLWLTEKLVKVGEYINPGQPIFKAGKREHLIMNMELHRDEIKGWAKGDKVEVESQGEKREAVITNINQIARSGSERSRVQLRVENSQLDWYPGSLAQIKSGQGMGQQVLVPAKSIYQGENPYVYIVKDETVYRQEVKLGLIEGSKISVTGLEDEALVVTGGLHRLTDGQLVNIREGY
ncbi:MAG TPA: efflux RND transporter periplasmic adaptor subunit [Syntrophomonadaceae bacterium]|nr:efflux RND transporter periplasmic adaptor subunit [Syntrophomonadaceae bacterium]